MNRFTLIFIFLFIFTLPVYSHGEGVSEIEFPENAKLPVTRVTLYTAGLAQIVHETTVSGNEVINFSIEPNDINDILKSLVVEDLGGGTVDVVNFHSSDPLSVVLSDLRVNPSGSPALSDFLIRSQGEFVSVTTADGKFEGRIFSVEKKQEGDSQLIFLNLMNSSGIIPVNITRLENLRFTDPALQNELMSALGTIAGSRVKTMRTLKISFTGEGERKVRLSYIRAVPLWKTSYRIVLDESGTPRLEGWAIVQNTGGSNWKDVKLSFVAGQPNAFTMDLATPRYVARQNVETAAAAPLGPTSYEKAYASEAPAAAMKRSFAEAAPMAMDDDFYYETEESYTPPPVAAQASGIREGNFYRYEVKNPVTVEARSSAMIPIIQQDEAGTPIGVYDPAHDLVFKGLQLVNNSDAHWAAGPVTVIEGRYYGGDAMLPDMIPGSNRLLTYAVHGTLEVEKSLETEPQRITALKIADGILYRTDKIMRKTAYRIDGKGEELLIIHPKDYGWKLTESPGIFEENSGEYRFIISDFDNPVSVSEEYIVSNQFSLSGLRTQDLGFYLEWEQIPPAIKKVLERIARLRQKTESIATEINSLNSNLSRIQRDQNRIRENMKVLDKESELFKQYSQLLASQEEDIRRLNEEIQDHQASLDKADRDLRDYIGSIEIN